MAGKETGPRYPCQLVVMVTERTDEAVREVSDVSGRSLSDILRETIELGLPIAVGRIRRAQRGISRAIDEAREGAA